MKNEIQEFAFHNDAIQKFNNELYEGIFTNENITSKHKAINLHGEKFYGYFLEKDKIQYFMFTEHMEDLPFKITKYDETDYKGEVFRMIQGVKSINIPATKQMTFRELVDVMPAFTHTNPYHFTLYKILAIAAYSDRINVRISTDAGFGKDSVVGIIQQLVDSTVNIYGATFAKLEYSLINKLMILNELGNLKNEEKFSMQEFLLATGAYFNTYTKRTRKTATTQEQYDISKLSLLIFYNLPEYYVGKAQEYFDQIFTKAVIHRFIPFVFEGRLTTKFEKVLDIDTIMRDNESLYKDVIATLNFYRQNTLKEIKYVVPKSVVFPDTLKRYERTFNVILKYVSEYSRTQEEFDELVTELYSCYKNYEKLIVKEKEML
jgi:hypothetical protein